MAGKFAQARGCAMARAHLTGYGLVVENQTKVVLMRRESIPLPMAYLDQSTELETRMDLLGVVDTALKQAEQVGRSLSDAVFLIAKLIYPRPGAKPEDKLSPDQRIQVDRIASSISTLAEYWASLERPFYQLVLDLPEAQDPATVQTRWLEDLITAGRAALAESEARAGQYPKALKASRDRAPAVCVEPA